MAVAHVQNHTAGTSLTGTALTLTLAANVASGNVLIAWVGFDNTGSTTPTVSSLSVPGGESATWAQIAKHDSSTATSAGGVRGEMWAIRTTQQWNDTSTITVTLSASPPKAAGVLSEFSGVLDTRRGPVGTGGTSTGGTPTFTTSGTTPVNGDLVLGGATFESNAAATDDADTSNGTWSAGTKTNTATGGSAANVSVILQHKIITATASQTYNPTGASDSGATAASLQSDAGSVAATPAVIARAATVDRPDVNVAAGSVGLASVAALPQATAVTATDATATPAVVTATATLPQATATGGEAAAVPTLSSTVRMG